MPSNLEVARSNLRRAEVIVTDCLLSLARELRDVPLDTVARRRLKQLRRLEQAEARVADASMALDLITGERLRRNLASVLRRR
jgi:hypothetical protein